MNQSNHVIQSKEDLLNHIGSFQKLEIDDLTQMEKLLKMNVPPDVWKDALNGNQELVQNTKELSYYNREIEYIHLLSFLTNITELQLYCNNISDISSIYKLKKLKKLDFRSNNIEDISALQYLSDLTHLDLQGNQLTSYTLALPNLIELTLDYNKIEDKSGLKYSPKLQSLNLIKTEIADLRTIPHQLFGLKALELYNNNILEISYLSNFVDLQNLSLGFNKQLQNIGPLQFCTQLTQLSVDDIWPLQFMKNLKILDIANTQIVDLHPLQYLYKLEIISAFCTRIADMSPLLSLTQLNFFQQQQNYQCRYTQAPQEFFKL
ncbi:leucine-rich_repeat domain-containing protein [Hexamita inflata]|uniref:Partial n=1 Tax=Hexamita inflata TaxID=28002 RepID=A0AA86QI61_9EUKA|nr:leucine-rich repeat domain-containing protein [Hexamita inflata]